MTVTSYCSPSLAQPSPAERELVRYTLVTSERPTDRQPWPSAHLEHTHIHREPYQTACLETLLRQNFPSIAQPAPRHRSPAAVRRDIASSSQALRASPLRLRQHRAPLQRVRPPPVTSSTLQTRPANAEPTFTRSSLLAFDSPAASSCC